METSLVLALCATAAVIGIAFLLRFFEKRSQKHERTRRSIARQIGSHRNTYGTSPFVLGNNLIDLLKKTTHPDVKKYLLFGLLDTFYDPTTTQRLKPFITKLVMDKDSAYAGLFDSDKSFWLQYIQASRRHTPNVVLHHLKTIDSIVYKPCKPHNAPKVWEQAQIATMVTAMSALDDLNNKDALYLAYSILCDDHDPFVFDETSISVLKSKIARQLQSHYNAKVSQLPFSTPNSITFNARPYQYGRNAIRHGGSIDIIFNYECVAYGFHSELVGMTVFQLMRRIFNDGRWETQQMFGFTVMTPGNPVYRSNSSVDNAFLGPVLHTRSYNTPDMLNSLVDEMDNVVVTHVSVGNFSTTDGENFPSMRITYEPLSSTSTPAA